MRIVIANVNTCLLILYHEMGYINCCRMADLSMKLVVHKECMHFAIRIPTNIENVHVKMKIVALQMMGSSPNAHGTSR